MVDRGDVPPAGDAADVLLGEVVVAQSPARLVTAALGSCVGVAIWDRASAHGGLAHVMLPTPASGAHGVQPGRFADWAVPELVRLLEQRGSKRHHLCAKIAGGASMFRSDGSAASIGERNIKEVKRQLALMSVPLEAEDTGDGYARTVEFVLQTGDLLVRSYQFGVRRI